MVDQVYVVQFPHPGREHRPDKNDRKAWTRCEDGHGRLFVEQPGAYVRDLRQKATSDDLHFWCEWECEAESIGSFAPSTSKGFPRHVFRPEIRSRKRFAKVA